jgi:hypothetical protein
MCWWDVRKDYSRHDWMSQHIIHGSTSTRLVPFKKKTPYAGRTSAGQVLNEQYKEVPILYYLGQLFFIFFIFYIPNNIGSTKPYICDLLFSYSESDRTHKDMHEKL